MELFGNSFTSKNGDVDDSTLKSSKLIGIYFSAHWCPPCRGFTPILSEFYNKVNENERKIEIVFVSCDNDLETYNNYLSTMPWIALTLNHPLCETLSQKYSVSGIPRLLIIDTQGNIVIDNGRSDVVSMGPAAFDKWLKRMDKTEISAEDWDIIKNGELVKHSGHQHELRYTHVDAKHDAYSGGWSCNECGAYFGPEVSNLWCKQCDYDVCKKCYEPAN